MDTVPSNLVLKPELSEEFILKQVNEILEAEGETDEEVDDEGSEEDAERVDADDLEIDHEHHPSRPTSSHTRHRHASTTSIATTSSSLSRSSSAESVTSRLSAHSHKSTHKLTRDTGKTLQILELAVQQSAKQPLPDAREVIHNPYILTPWSKEYRDMWDDIKLPTVLLERFDDKVIEKRSPADWLGIGKRRGLKGTPGFARFFRVGSDSNSAVKKGNEEWEWKPCFVIDYDEEERLYLIEWKDGGGQKWVTRVSFSII